LIDPTNKTEWRLLALGALVGLIAAGYGVLRQASSGEELPEYAVAKVNDSIIGRDLFDRMMTRTSSDGSELPGANKGRVLQSLIDDELLVQRGIELGMTESDATVRQSIINSLIASVTAEADAASPTEEELGQYLAANAERFSFTSKISVEVWQTDDGSAAQAFITTLRLHDSPPADDSLRAMPDIPPGLMSPDILASYTGPGIAAATAEMPEGSSAVFARRGRWLVIRLVAKERLAVTDLGTIRNRVLIDYRRNLADEALNNYLLNLRQQAEITVTQP
jgi:SurA-like protein